MVLTSGTLFDDGHARPGSSSEISQISSQWTLALFRLVKSPCSAGGAKLPCLVSSSTLLDGPENGSGICSLEERSVSPKPDVPVCSAEVSCTDNAKSTSLCCHEPDCGSQVSHLVSLVQSLETRLAVLETALQRSQVSSCQDGHAVPGLQEVPPAPAAPSCFASAVQAQTVVETTCVSMPQALDCGARPNPEMRRM